MKNKKNIIGEAFRYLVVGGCTTLVNLIIFSILCYGTVMGDTKMGITVSNIIAISAAIVFAYITNKIFVFRSKTNSFYELIVEMCKFVGARLGTMIIEVLGVWFLVFGLKLNEMVGKLLTQVFVVIGNYFISKFLVFKREKDEY